MSWDGGHLLFEVGGSLVAWKPCPPILEVALVASRNLTADLDATNNKFHLITSLADTGLLSNRTS